MTEKTLAEVQFQMLETFIEDPVKLEENIELVHQYNYDLLEILGYFPATQEGDGSAPNFVSIAGEHFGVDHEVYVLPFYVKGTEGEFYKNNKQDEANLIEVNVFLFNDLIRNTAKNTPVDHCYFRIKFNLNKENQEYGGDVLVISMNDLARYAKVIVALSNVTSLDQSIVDLWQIVPLVKLRSQLYQYAMQHEDVEKIWLSIISTTLYVYIELKSQHFDLQHKQIIEEMIQPTLSEKLMLSINNIQEGVMFIEKENFQDFDRSAILYNSHQWHFWLLRWFRIRKTTPLITIQPE